MNSDSGGELYDFMDMHPEVRDEFYESQRAVSEKNLAKAEAEAEEIDRILTEF